MADLAQAKTIYVDKRKMPNNILEAWSGMEYVYGICILFLLVQVTFHMKS